MEISWYGHSCFRLTERSMATVVMDPYDAAQVGHEALKLKADILTVSHNKPGHNHHAAVKGAQQTITGPGEFEIGGVFITGVQTNGFSRKTSDEPRNTLYLIDYNGINVLHLGGMDRVPSQSEVEDLGPINILLAPVGGGSSLNAAKAVEVIALLEPNIVIPMHYAAPGSLIKLDPLSKFIKEMGLADIAPVPSFKATSVNALPDETQVVVLEMQRS